MTLCRPRRTLAISAPISEWSLTRLKEPLFKISAKVVSHGRYVAFQMAEVAVPRTLFADPAGTTGEVHLDDDEIGFPGPECACDIGIRAWRCPLGKEGSLADDCMSQQYQHDKPVIGWMSG